MPTQPKKKISFDLEPALIEDIKEITKELGVKQSDFLRKAVYAYLYLSMQNLQIFKIENSSIKKTSVNIFDIEKIENTKLDNDLILLGFKTAGKMHLSNGKIISFVSLYNITNRSVERLKMIHSTFKDKLPTFH